MEGLQILRAVPLISKIRLLIMTSNIGAGYLLDGIKEDGSISKEAQDMAMNDLRAHFRPEFLNRLDEIIMFKPLTKEKYSCHY